MRYDVLKDFEDKEFPVVGADSEKAPLHLTVGEVFIPAQFNYPTNKRDGLVLNGTIKLIEPEVPESADAELSAERPPSRKAKAKA